MAVIRSITESDPLRDPDIAYQTMRVLTLLNAMGLIELDEPLTNLELKHLRGAAAAAAKAGIGRHVQPLLASPQPTTQQVTSAVRQLAEALADSPLPGSETRELAAIFGWPGLARLIDASAVSLRRYAAGLRDAPDEVANRIHWLAKVVGDLRGAYNDAGIRRWFGRPRAQLDMRAPRDLLAKGWSPDQPEIRAVRQLAAELVGGGAT
jgi:hypothetical protein